MKYLEITEVPLEKALVCRRSMGNNGRMDYPMTNVPWLVIDHSPDGYEWGYGGSGPADLALNLCEWYLRHIGYQGEVHSVWKGKCFRLASRLHQPLKNDLIARIPNLGGSIDFHMIEAWMKIHIPAENLYPVLEEEEET